MTHTKLTASRNKRRIEQLAPLAKWQARKLACLEARLLDSGFDDDNYQPLTAADHFKLHEWLRLHKPPTF